MGRYSVTLLHGLVNHSYNVVGSTLEPAFKPRTAMNFNGATATSNLMFADDESCTISTHSIKVMQLY